MNNKDLELLIPSQTEISKIPQKINLYRSKHSSTGDLINYDQNATNNVSFNFSKDYDNS